MILNTDSAQLDRMFDALSNAKRRGILHTLSFRPATVSQLAQEYDLSLQAMHKHVRALEAAELIKRRKVGRTNCVALNRQSLRATQDWIMQYHTDWGSDDESLENYITGLQESRT